MAVRLSAIVVLLLALALPPALIASPTLAAPAEATSERWIVQLADPPLAQYGGEQPVYAAQALRTAARVKLDLASGAAQQYLAELQRRQAELFARIQSTFPAAELQRQYQVVFNGLTLKLAGADQATLAGLRALPGVLAVYPDGLRERHAFSNITQIGADKLWSTPAIGGQANAGAGIKIAVIDAGIKLDNPYFNPEGFSYPEGFPQGETDYTTPKVIVARAYFNPDFPPLPGNETPEPGDDGESHGTHVAGIAAGDAETTASLGELQLSISGVAPRAYLLNYKTFYASERDPSGGTAFQSEFIAALEDAVKDGADVINNSWGGLAVESPRFAPDAQAAEAAVDAGVVVVFSAGNLGPDPSTAGSPGFSDKVISVGASTETQFVAPGVVDVIAPDGVPAALRDQQFGPAEFGPSITGTVVGPLPYLPVETATGSTLACDPLPEQAMAGKIALVERGVCPFSVKVFNAQQSGAAAAIIYNSLAGGEELIGMAPGPNADQITIPAVSVARSVGIGMTDWYGQKSDAVLVSIDVRPRVVAGVADTIVKFSSRGPSFQGSLKPDLVAPGYNILSSGYGPGEGSAKHLGFGAVSGTSMSAPHVAGAAALLLQAHPDWTPAEVKSALMSTATTELWLDPARTQPAGVLDRGAGRINVERAATAELLFDRPALSFGALAASPDQPTEATLSVTARNVSGARQTYTLEAQVSGAAVSVTPATLTLATGASTQFSVAIEIPAGAPAGDYEGQVVLGGGPQPLHLPLWARALPAEQGAKVLLLDNDGSSSLDLPDYAGYYGNLLSEQNISFHYLDLDALAGQPQTLPGLQELQRYEIVLWFTGDNPVPSGALPVPTPLTPADQNLLIAYLQGGGNLIASGQDLASASGVEGLYVGYLGAIPVQTDVFTETGSAERSVVGTGAQPWLEGIRLDLGLLDEDQQPGEASSAGNQRSVDEIVFDTDPTDEDIDRYAVPLLRAESSSAQAGGLVAMAHVDEPTLEKPELGIPYRSTYLAFGLEGVRSDTGATSRKELLQQILYWTVDHPGVTLSAPESAEVGQEVTLSATAQSNTPASFTRYRWDFGDGTPVAETVEPSVSHRYNAAGSYQLRVEVTNSWGHRAIGGRSVGVSGGAGAGSLAAPLRAL